MTRQSRRGAARRAPDTDARAARQPDPVLVMCGCTRHRAHSSLGLARGVDGEASTVSPQLDCWLVVCWCTCLYTLAVGAHLGGPKGSARAVLSPSYILRSSARECFTPPSELHFIPQLFSQVHNGGGPERVKVGRCRLTLSQTHVETAWN